MFDFSGKSAIVTGAASGIGRATAAYLHESGAQVLAADINSQGLEALGAELDPQGKSLAHLCYDAGNAEDADRAVALCVERFGKVDIVVAAASIYEDQHIGDMTDEQWRKTVGINLDGVFYLIRRALPFMPEGSAIVNVASTAAHQGGSFRHSHYGTTKGGVLAFTRGLAKDVAPAIRVNAVSPGTIDTPMGRQAIKGREAEVLSRIPLQRYGQPREVASVIAFLCSDAASFISGETIIISGGEVMC